MSAHGPGPVPPADQLAFDLPGLRTAAPQALLQAVAPDPGADAGADSGAEPMPWPGRPLVAVPDPDALTAPPATPNHVLSVPADTTRPAVDLAAVTQTPELFTLDGPALSLTAAEPAVQPAADLVPEPRAGTLLAPAPAGRVWLVWEDDEVLGVYADPAVAETEVDTLRRNARRTRTQVSYECLPVPVFDTCRHRRSTAPGAPARS